MSHLEFMFQYTEAKVNTVQRQIFIPDFNPITDNWAKLAKFKTRLKETYKLLYYAGANSNSLNTLECIHLLIQNFTVKFIEWGVLRIMEIGCAQ